MTRKKKNEAAVAVEEPPPLPQEEIEQDEIASILQKGAEPEGAQSDPGPETTDIALDHEGLPVEDADPTPQSKFARGVLALITDNLDRNYPKGRAILKKAKASPEGSAAALEELAELYRSMGSFISLRAVAMRNGPGEPNALLAITARNVHDALTDAAVVVDQAPHLPSSWSRAESRIAEAQKACKAAMFLLGQEGASLVAREESPLTDGEGRPLV